jgi:hypothetical protein
MVTEDTKETLTLTRPYKLEEPSVLWTKVTLSGLAAGGWRTSVNCTSLGTESIIFAMMVAQLEANRLGDLAKLLQVEYGQKEYRAHVTHPLMVALLSLLKILKSLRVVTLGETTRGF